MRPPDLALRPILLAAVVIGVVVAGAIGAVLLVLRAWNEPYGGPPIGGDRLVRGLRAAGPALQSAPQVEGAAYRREMARELAASEAAR